MKNIQTDRHLVSCQVLGQIFIICDEKGIDSRELLSGIPYSREHIETPSNFIDWDSLVRLLDQGSRFFTEEEVLQHAMNSYNQPLFKVYKLIGQLRFDLRGFYLYLFGEDSIVTTFYPMTSEVLQDDPHARILRFRIRSDPGLTPSLQMSRILAGQAQGIPAVMGYTEGLVDVVYLEDGVELTIHYPDEKGFIARFRKLLRLPLRLAGAATELQTLQDTLLIRNRELTVETRGLKATEEALRQQQEQMSIIVDTMPIVLWVFDLDYRARYVSPSVERLFGYSVEEALNLDPMTLVDEDSARKITREVERLSSVSAEELRTTHAMRVHQVRKDGSLFWSESYFTTTRDLDGNPTGMVVISVDVDEKVEQEHREAAMQDQLAVLSRQELVGKLAGGIAHDFNNYLQSIIGFSELSQSQLARLPADTIQLVHNQNQIIHSAKSAAELVGQLLAFSRQQTLAMRPMNLATWLNEKENLFRSIAGEQVTLELSPGRGHTIMADPLQMERVLINLLLNARDAMTDADATIWIEILQPTREQLPVTLQERDEKFACLAVTDNGCGISEDMIDRLFDPYFSTKEDDQSAGLGLAVCAGIIGQHGGLIRPVLPTSQRGVRFELFLPATDQQLTSDTDGSSVDFSILQGKKVLVADDQQLIRELVTSILAGEGMEVSGASNGFEAIDVYKAEPDIDVVILDVVMPGMNGDVARQKLQQMNPGCSVLFMTGYAGNPAVVDSLKDSIVLSKPFTRSELLAAVLAALA